MTTQVCKHCKKSVRLPHTCPVTETTYRDGDEGDFLLSAVVGAATDSALIGGLVGGDFLGGIVGQGISDLLGDDDSSSGFGGGGGDFGGGGSDGDW